MVDIKCYFNIIKDLVSSEKTTVIIDNNILSITDSIYNCDINGYSNNKHKYCINITTYEYSNNISAPNPEITILIYTEQNKLIENIKLLNYSENMLLNGRYIINNFINNNVNLKIDTINVEVINNNVNIILNTIKENDDEIYDYVIIGFGACTSVVAYNLGRDSSVKTLILEKGTNQLNNPNVLNPYKIGVLQNDTSITNQVLSTSNNTNGYGRNLLVKIGNTWGGGSSINYMVYDRGSSQEWSFMSKYNKVFDYNNLLENFWKKVEHYTGEPIDTPEYHGYSGDYYQVVAKSNALTNYYVNGFKNVLGLNYYMDNNAFQEEGIFPATYQNKVNFNDPDPYAFTRSSFSIGYTQNIVYADGSPLPNSGLKIKSQCLVDKLDINKDTGKVIGVYYIEGDVSKYVKVRKLVILGAGAYGSPAILQRSGIGNSNDLAPLGINTIINNNNVGNNLKIQYGLNLLTKVDKNISDNCPLNKYNYFAFGGLSYFPTIINGKESELKRACYNFLLNLVITQDSSVTGLAQKLYDSKTQTLMSYEAWSLSPYTKGNVKINSKDPLININYTYDTYSDSRDIDVSIYMLDTALKVINDMNEQAGKEIISIAYPENFSSYLVNRESKEVLLKSLPYPTNHPYGTCVISDNALTGVVDKNLHVFGLNNVMITDASVLCDNSVSAGTGSQLFALGHAASEIIKNMYGNGIITY